MFPCVRAAEIEYYLASGNRTTILRLEVASEHLVRGYVGKLAHHSYHGWVLRLTIGIEFYDVSYADTCLSQEALVLLFEPLLIENLDLED